MFWKKNIPNVWQPCPMLLDKYLDMTLLGQTFFWKLGLVGLFLVNDLHTPLPKKEPTILTYIEYMFQNISRLEKKYINEIFFFSYVSNFFESDHFNKKSYKLRKKKC